MTWPTHVYRIQPPGTNHMVYTLQNGLTSGGHFLSYSTRDQTYSLHCLCVSHKFTDLVIAVQMFWAVEINFVVKLEWLIFLVKTLPVTVSWWPYRMVIMGNWVILGNDGHFVRQFKTQSGLCHTNWIWEDDQVWPHEDQREVVDSGSGTHVRANTSKRWYMTMAVIMWAAHIIDLSYVAASSTLLICPLVHYGENNFILM